MHMLGAAPAALKVNIMVFEIYFPDSNILIAFYEEILLVRVHFESQSSKSNLLPSSHSSKPLTNLSPHVVLHIYFRKG